VSITTGRTPHWKECGGADKKAYTAPNPLFGDRCEGIYSRTQPPLLVTCAKDPIPVVVTGAKEFIPAPNPLCW
jgi:hypothetical protein